MSFYLYFCLVKQKRILTILTCIAMVISFVFLHKPIITRGITKQTIYQWLLNICYLQPRDAQPTALLIDDDSGYGIYSIKHLCDDIGIKATFVIFGTHSSIKDSFSEKRTKAVLQLALDRGYKFI